MHVERYKVSIAEALLNGARDEFLEHIAQITDRQGAVSGEFAATVAVKARCVLAFFAALGSVCLKTTYAVGLSLCSYLPGRSVRSPAEAWEEVHVSLDLMFTAAAGIFDSEAILSAADRGNVRRIAVLGKKLQDVTSLPGVDPKTMREFDAWYSNAKVFVRKGGHSAKHEMSSLSDALEHLRQSPDMEAMGIMSWRWDKGGADSVEVAKVRGIQWQPAPMAPAEPPRSLSQRVWKKKERKDS